MRRPIAVAALLAAGLAVAACARVVAPAPPVAAPDTQLVGTVGGDPRLVAARAARRLQDMGYTTRRFATDSLWGARPSEGVAARLRYAMPGNDSTRVLIELWGRCARRGCLRRDALDILQRLEQDEGPPT